ncbi:S-adenosyl-L-methionine-dependent methyltransferase [Aspergillus pseudotamarii]|uniref:tRNA (adenine(58)-N(1))-methyltransferase catalytic subunit TRM61 n=1 Tax=Aspergillus pseudotamarii TaxID=132259 RepID=A0A5N6SF20_ASPPS|nr:S-adenosyl-L-methionine-dependent methyltransferase [Aspergillus pseudotamarii]KAE8133252.1 S-adenosyl-L-methionine-dependent methyltransferase [Aspergillus pseudotamarii]
MARMLQSLRRALGLTSPKPVPTFRRSIDTDFSVFREGDRAIIHGKTPSLTKPLQPGQKTDLRRGYLEHSSIIGRRVRERIQAQKGQHNINYLTSFLHPSTGPEYRLTLPTLDEYVVLTPRLVTPIYAADANLIVSLLDIHVAPPAEGEEHTQQPLEILESGTGHGSLTLHLARAIQAANPTPPPLPAQSQIQYLQGRPVRPDEKPEEKDKKSAPKNETAIDPTQQQWDTWRSQRRAIIHTVDVSPKFSAHAEKIVRGFRRGLYAGNVDFYVGHVENWITEQKRLRTPTSLLPLTQKSADPFLSYAILDMPAAHQRITHVAPILKENGVLAVFMPSITQIGDCVDLIRRQKLPFILEKVVELGAGISSGRQWDVRFAVRKSRADPSSWNEPSETSEGAVHQDREALDDGSVESISTPEEAPKEEDNVLVCRPKVGSRIVGGGFVGVWRRIEDSQKQ